MQENNFKKLPKCDSNPRINHCFNFFQRYNCQFEKLLILVPRKTYHDQAMCNNMWVSGNMIFSRWVGRQAFFFLSFPNFLSQENIGSVGWTIFLLISLSTDGVSFMLDNPIFYPTTSLNCYYFPHELRCEKHVNKYYSHLPEGVR